ncbi:MAG: energy transducer TonB [Oceanihabitans sp.]
MKKTILIFFTVLLALCLTAFNVINWDDLKTESTKNKEIAVNATFNTNKILESNQASFVGPFLNNNIKKPKNDGDFNYNFGPRFSPLKKSALKNIKSIADIFTEEEMQSIEKLKSVEIIVINNVGQTNIREIGYTKELTEAQIKLLQSFDYESHFNIRAEYLKKNTETGKLEDSFNSPHLTIVPEKQAIYLDGKKAFIQFFKENSREARLKAKVDPYKMQPAKLYFTITKEGKIKNARLNRTSNYQIVDKNMLEIIEKLPGKWKPAENSKGEKMEQEFAVSFGLLGC